MEKLKINCPEGFVIDKEKSNLSTGDIYFKKSDKPVTYESIMDEVKPGHYINVNGRILFTTSSNFNNYDEPHLAKDKAQLESILAINMLKNVANYFNRDWDPQKEKTKYFWGLKVSPSGAELEVLKHESVYYSCVYFRSKKAAEKAKEILGEETIYKSLFLTKES